MPSQNVARKPEPDIPETGRGREETELCKRIVEMDPAIRVAAIIDDVEILGYADSAAINNILRRSSDLRTKMGFWVRMITEISRQNEPLFGPTELISFVHKGLILATLPISGTRSLGLSLDRSADVNAVVQKIRARLNLDPTRNR